MKKSSGKINIHWSTYEPYTGEVVRFSAPIGEQFFVMELQRFDTTWYEDDAVVDWNVCMGIVDEVTDEAFYTIDENEAVGKTPFETYRVAMRALNELLKFMETEYEDDIYGAEHIYHHIYVWNAKGRRLKIYDRILKRLGWDECEWDDEHSYRKVVCGKLPSIKE